MNPRHFYYIITFFLLSLNSLYTKLAAQDNGWLNRYGSTETNLFSSSLLTPEGDIIITGYFKGGEGKMPIGKVELISQAPIDKYCGFIARVNSSGETVWAQILQSSFEGVLHTATLDNGGNIYVAGNFLGELTFGSQIYSSAPSTVQSFLAKYDPNGKPIWIWMAPASVYFSAFNAIASDSLNNIYFAHQESQVKYTGQLGYYLKLLKFDVHGNLLLDRIVAASGNSIGCSSIKFDSQLQPVLLGSYYNDIKIGNLEHQTSNDFSMFLAKSTVNGATLWSKDIGRSAVILSGLSEVAIDKTDNIYVAGSFSDTPEKVTILKKFNQNGSPVWQQTIDRIIVPYLGGLSGTSLKITRRQDVILTGYFSGDVSFGSTHFTNAVPEYTNLFITRVSSDGQITGAIRSNSKGAVTPMSLLLNDNEEFYVSGSFASDNFVFYNLNSEKTGNYFDIFLLKASLELLGPILEPVEPKDITIPNIITPNGDGKNDAFVIADLELNAVNPIMIYNRWGKLVYQSKAYRNDWTAAGLPPGSYFYILQHQRTDKQYKGWIEVTR